MVRKNKNLQEANTDVMEATKAVVYALRDLSPKDRVSALHSACRFLSLPPLTYLPAAPEDDTLPTPNAMPTGPT